MKRIILAAAFAVVMTNQALTQEITVPSANELKAAIESDDRFTLLMTEIWVLRDVLALQAGGDISADAKEFQALQDNLRNQRRLLIDTLSREQAKVELPKNVAVSLTELVATLNSFGVRQDSDLGRRLILANVLFSQSLAATSLGSLCDFYPFRMHCPAP